MFCKKCGSLLVPKKSKSGKTKFVCRKCGRASRSKMKIKKSKPKKEKLFFVDKKEENLPETKEDCPKCPSKKVYYWIIQTRAADEPATKFFKCVKCGHVWRDYS